MSSNVFITIAQSVEETVLIWRYIIKRGDLLDDSHYALADGVTMLWRPEDMIADDAASVYRYERHALTYSPTDLN